MKEARVFVEKKLRIEGQSLTKEQVAEVLKRLFGTEARIERINQQTAFTEVLVQDYHSSHLVVD